MKLPPYIDPSASDWVQAPSERKRIALEAVDAEHKEAEGHSE